MKVIGAGFGRTGTMSLKAALEELGFGPCYHMSEVFEHPEHVKYWEAAWRGAPVDWDEFLGDYEATTDWPACAFYGELMKRYPDAKVLLSVRDPEQWYESTLNTIYRISEIITGSPTSRVVFSFVGLIVPGIRKIGRMNDEIIWQDTFGGEFENKQHAIEVFERHNKEVQQRVPKDRLLVYEAKQGWEPLCEFLGVEEPEVPFPRLNDSEEMKRRIRIISVLAVAVPAAALALLAVTTLLLFGRPVRSTTRTRK